MKIRPMIPEDFDEIYFLWTSLPLDMEPYDIEKEEVLETLKLNPASCLVAEENNKILGGVIGAFNGRRGWIHHLAIDKKYQKKGYGAMLLKAAEDALRKRGAKKFLLTVEYKNLDTLPFYMKKGYTPYHEALILRKFLK